MVVVWLNALAFLSQSFIKSDAGAGHGVFSVDIRDCSLELQV